ncbi:hypothetical protein ENHAE0001_1255 [Enhydrobacter aerosaccus SK60]|nr:hypothetical protein ENHAE0001_1255 [Enhydrobacter aerosaccus SK60]
MKQVGKKPCFEAREINGFERILTSARVTAQENPQLGAWR